VRIVKRALSDESALSTDRHISRDLLMRSFKDASQLKTMPKVDKKSPLVDVGDAKRGPVHRDVVVNIAGPSE
jgi:hypothetical protein